MANVVEIIIKQSGQGNAISATVKELGGLDSAASNSIGTLGKFGGALANMATVAGGIVVANIFGKIAQGISSVVSTGLDAVGSNQQLETSLKSLLTANNMYQETTETMTVAVGNLVEMQAEAAAKSDDLAFKQKKLTAEINTQNASIQEQRQRIMQMADGLDKNQQVARLQEMEIALEGMNRELSDTVTEQGKLNNVTQEYETVSKTTLKTVMSQADAFKLASSQTQDLLDFVSKLAVTSPFETETVEDVTKYAIAAGMGVEATKEFIPAFLDLAGAVGISSDSLGFAADQLFQVKKVGKLTEIDLRQLRRIGIDLSKVIGVEMGMSVEEFNAKAATTPEIFDELFDAVTRFSQNTFAGTSAEMATSVKGLQSTISDIFVIGSRTFMRPLVDAVTPAISGIIGKLSDFVLGGDLETIGQQAAKTLMSGLSSLSNIGSLLSTGDFKGGIFGLEEDSLPIDLLFRARDAFISLSGGIDKVKDAFDRFGLKGATVSVLGMLGMDPEMIGAIRTTITNVVTTVTDGFNRVKDAFNVFGVQGAAFTLLSVLGLSPETLISLDRTLTTITDTVTEKFNILKTIFDQFGVQGVAISLMDMLGLSSETIGFITTAIGQISTVLGSLGSKELIGALTGVGVVLAGIVAGGAIAAIVAGLTTLLTPINLIIAGVALLGAAWAGNWGGIQEITWQVLATLTEVFTTLSALVMSVVNTLVTTAWPQLQGAFTSINEGLANLGLTWGDVFTAIATATGIVLGVVISAVGGIVTAVASAIGTMAAVWETLTGMIGTFLDGVTQSWIGFGSILMGLVTGDLSRIGEGVQSMLQGVINIIVGLLGTAVTLVAGPFAVILSTVGGFVDGFIAMFTGLYNTLVGNSIIPDLVNDIVAWFKKLPQMALSALGNIGSTLAAPFLKAWDAISEAMNIDKWYSLGGDLMTGLLEGITKNSAAVLEYLKNLAWDSLASLKGIWQSSSPSKAFFEIGQSAPQGVIGGVQSLQGQVKDAFSGLGNISSKAFVDAMDVGAQMHALGASNVNDLKDIFKLNAQGVMDILGSGGGEGELSALLGQQAAIWGVPPQFAQDLAQANGLFGQLIDQYGEFARATRLENLGRLTQMAASFSGLGSTFAGMLEEQMAGGEEAKKTVEAYQAAINKLTASEGANQEAIDKKQLAIEKANEALGFGERQMAIYQQELDALMQDEEGNALQIEKKVLQMDKLTESMDAQSKQLLTLQSELNKLTGDMEKNQQAVKATEESYKALQAQAFDLFSGNQTDSQRISSELATIALLEDFLKSGAESFLIPADAVSQAAGITGILYDQISGQQELNRLLEEQAEREALITAEREARQKLDFLQQQLDLIKLGRELGGNLLQGINFGLDANLEDMLAAVNAITTAMVNQIDEDLGIASPSKVLFDKFKKQVGGGMVEGLLAVKPMIQGAIQPMLDPLLNGAAAAGKVVNNYFNQVVNTNADQSSVIGDFRTMQLMAGP